MEARRTFDVGAKSSSQIWIVVAALLAILALGVAGAYFAKGLTSSAPAGGHVVRAAFTQSDNAMEHAQLQRAKGAASLTDRNAGNSYSGSKAMSDGRTGPQIAP